MLTECCGRTIDAQDRYCPKCGYECRVVGIVERMINEGSIGTGPDRNHRDNPLRLLLGAYPEARLVVPTLMEDLELCANRIDDALLAAGRDPAPEAPKAATCERHGSAYYRALCCPNCEHEAELMILGLRESARVSLEYLRRIRSKLTEQNIDGVNVWENWMDDGEVLHRLVDTYLDTAAETPLPTHEARQDWQPISEAPKDGTHILAKNARTEPTTVHWHVDGWYLSVNLLEAHADYEANWGPLTIWMPLPAPPAATEAK